MPVFGSSVGRVKQPVYRDWHPFSSAELIPFGNGRGACKAARLAHPGAHGSHSTVTLPLCFVDFITVTPRSRWEYNQHRVDAIKQ